MSHRQRVQKQPKKEVEYPRIYNRSLGIVNLVFSYMTRKTNNVSIYYQGYSWKYNEEM